jgi:hypothetical protein
VGKKTGPNPTDRGKLGVKRSILVEANGIPIGIAVAPANVHDNQLIEETFSKIRVKLPAFSDFKLNLCLDKGYAGDEHRSTVMEYGYRPHIPQKKNSKAKYRRQQGRRKARRWVVERSASWLNKFRRLLVRWEKKVKNYQAMIALACATQILGKIQVCG